MNYFIKCAAFFFVALVFTSWLLPASELPPVQRFASLDGLDRAAGLELAPLPFRSEAYAADAPSAPLVACQLPDAPLPVADASARYSLTFVNNVAVPITIKSNTTLSGTYCPRGEIATFEVAAGEDIIIEIAEKGRCAKFLFKSSMVVFPERRGVPASYRTLWHVPGATYVMHKYVAGLFEIETITPDSVSVTDWWRLVDMTDMAFYDDKD